MTSPSPRPITCWAGTTRRYTTDVDQHGNRIVDVPVDLNLINAVYHQGDTVLVKTDLLAKRDWAIICPVEGIGGKHVGMFGVGVDASSLAGEQWQIVKKELIFALVFLLGTLILAVVLAHYLTAPLEAFQKVIDLRPIATVSF